MNIKYKKAIRILESDIPVMLTKKDGYKAIHVYSSMAKCGFSWNEEYERWIYKGLWSKRK